MNSPRKDGSYWWVVDTKFGLPEPQPAKWDAWRKVWLTVGCEEDSPEEFVTVIRQIKAPK